MKKLIIILLILNFTNYFEIRNNDYRENLLNQITINKINLSREIYSYKESNVNKNIIYLRESDISNNFYILAAHSGNSNISYFKDLNKLVLGDEIQLIFNNKKMTFNVEEIYFVKKTGKIILPVGLNDTLYLTTCDKYNNDRQLIIKSVKKV